MKKLALISLLFSPALWAFSATDLVEAGRSQIGQTRYYDPAYSKLSYPMGDVPLVKGVCTDVVIRALRGQKMDLQQLIHEDMAKHFKHYPKIWGLKTTDRNIDHRRVPNIETYFKRQGYQLKNQPYQAGDIVTWNLPKGLTHIGILSDKTNQAGQPLVIHNIGSGTQEEDLLHKYPIRYHFRIKG
ncbi:NADH:ubiquinone oxidoreductase, Na [Pasteurellaceae bacterium RH1A]|nr:NADH:ubiquinone oxidoreductase, Na [Pasteurellaceae bacterium RH1A]